MRVVSFAVVCLLTCTLFVAADAVQVKKKKPPVKPTLGAIGTTQMPGAVCKVGQAYTLGKKDGNPFNVCITSVEYRATRIKTGKTCMYPQNADKKLIVVHFTVHNPIPKEQRYSSNIKWTAVTRDAQNIESANAYTEDKPYELVARVLKPAQKIALYTILEVPASGEIDKLIAANQTDVGSLVARFMLAGIAKRIAPPYVDPDDPSGATPLRVVKGHLNQAYEVGGYDVAVTGLESITEAVAELDASPPPSDKAYLFVTYRVTNMNAEGGTTVGFSGGWCESTVVDVDGGSTGPGNETFRTSAPTSLNLAVEYGQTVSFRKVYTVQRGAKLDYVKLIDHGSREIRIDLGGFVPM